MLDGSRRRRQTRSMSRIRIRSRSRSRDKSSSSLKYDFIWSKNKNYLLDKNNTKQLYIHESLYVPDFLKVIKTIKIKKAYIVHSVDMVYNLCKFDIRSGIEFKNDCLKFAECLTLKENSLSYDYDKEESFLKEKTTGKIFGDSDKKNIKIAKDVTKSYDKHFVNPEIGESYAIVRQEVKKGKMPYHIAYVLSKDGNSNITIEGDAGSSHLDIPKFCIYDVKQRRGLGTINETFYEAYNSYFKPCTTMVLIYKKN